MLEAFRLGAGMVLVSGCHLPYDCHYISGNYRMKDRMEVTAKILKGLKVSPERFRVEYISAAEGLKFAELINEMNEQLKTLGKEKIKAENERMWISRIFTRLKEKQP